MSTANKRKTLMMTDGEIRTSYRQAKDQKEQIKILSELNACSVDRICEILGIEVPRRKNTVKYLPHKWTDEDIRILYNMLRSGYGYAEIGEIIGVSKTAVMLKMREQWGSRAAVGRRGQRNSKTKKEKGNDDEMDGTTNWGGSRKKTGRRRDRGYPTVFGRRTNEHRGRREAGNISVERVTLFERK